MKKDFRKWHQKKKVIHNEQSRVFFKEREIWFCYLGENIGYEQDGRGEEFLRPIIVLKKFGNEVLWIVPLTQTIKHNKYYFAFSFRQDKISIAILSQMRLIDAKRLKYKVGDIDKKDFLSIKEKIRQFLA